MSASKSKRERQTMYQSGQLDKNEEANRMRKARRRRIRTAVIVVAVIAVLAAAAGLTASGFFAARVTAATVGGHDLSGTMFSYFYGDAYQLLKSQYGTQADQVLNPDVSFAQQTFSEEDGTTWADYFISQAAAAAAETYRMYDAAMAAGYTLSEEDAQSLAGMRESLDSIAAMLPDYKDADDYVRATYGRGCTADEYMEYTRIRLVASSYAADYKAGLSYAQAELEETYAANPADFDTVSYKIFYSSVVTGKNEDGTVQVDMERSEANARDMAEQCRGDVARFDELTVELAADTKKATYRDPSFSLRKNYPLSSANGALTDWLSDPARAYGDTTYVQADTNGYYVAFFIDYSDNDFDLVNLRHISVPAKADAENADDPDGMEQARTDAQAILDSFESGERTGEAFSKLSLERSSADGVYENYTPGLLDDAVDQWCFDEARRPGDYAMLRGADGYHLVWFDGTGDYYRDYLVDQKLRNDEYNAWHQETVAGDDAETHALGLFFMSK